MNNVQLLPLPEPECMGGNDVFGKEFPLFTAEQTEAYARANLAELQREVEGLRAEVETWKGLHASEVQVRQRWQARAERLAGALRIAIRQNSHDMLMTGDELRQCESALNPTAAQENDDA